jgi:hypothetical protein
MVRERGKQTQDPEEAGDCAVLIDLHQRHEKYVEAEIKLPELGRRVRMLEGIPSQIERLEEANFDLVGAEVVISEWHRMLAEWKETHEYVKANFRARGAMPPDEARSEDKPPAQSGPMTWQGTVRAFGDFVLKEFGEGRIPGATSQTKALEIMCSRYVQRNGKPLTPASVLQNLRNRKTEGK